MPGKTKTTKAKKTSATKKQTKKVVDPPVQEQVEETPVVESTVQDTPEESTSYDQEFSDLSAKLKDAMALVRGVMTDINKLEKRVARDRKVMDRKMKGRQKRVVDPNKPPSGFAKPGPVSDELRTFLKLGKDELIARTEVTKKITQYCKEHNLQKEEDKRTIHVDAPLRKLLRLAKGDELTFFNLQKYMKIHYPNKDGEFVSA
jgi:chromatin remodeling complex protein RSC6